MITFKVDPTGDSTEFELRNFTYAFDNKDRVEQINISGKKADGSSIMQRIQFAYTDSTVVEHLYNAGASIWQKRVVFHFNIRKQLIKRVVTSHNASPPYKTERLLNLFYDGDQLGIIERIPKINSQGNPDPLGKPIHVDWIGDITISQGEYFADFHRDMGIKQPWVYQGVKHVKDLDGEMNWGYDLKLHGNFLEVDIPRHVTYEFDEQNRVVHSISTTYSNAVATETHTVMVF